MYRSDPDAIRASPLTSSVYPGAVVPIPSLFRESSQKRFALSCVIYVPLPNISPPAVTVEPSKRFSSE
ncbi:MAG: hypothetical protein UU80_C0043G0004 [candidate division WWE3 bacterium GW2011_GWA1_41_8]|uniref:Uncharacterized protein n=1 Tax=candidate division WWE3 bacterium GW2011_GWA1_41_8 TaxID=1619103 RepID=A0A0G1A641_UNCKA|nr:MAG: hypothetical protein UU80_C0043G0004 [candidate division WWE3 bacterium GW2011_GWA1_41_8]